MLEVLKLGIRWIYKYTRSTYLEDLTFKDTLFPSEKKLRKTNKKTVHRFVQNVPVQNN